MLPSGLDAEPCEGESAAQITDYRHNSVRIGATTACPGLLVLTDVYMPGWEATVNGQEARVLPTDIAFRGVAIPAGDSVVEFSYRPASFRNGVVLMGLALVVLAGLVVRDRRRGTT